MKGCGALVFTFPIDLLTSLLFKTLSYKISRQSYPRHLDLSNLDLEMHSTIAQHKLKIQI